MATSRAGLRLTDGQLSFRGGVSTDVPRTKIIHFSGEDATTGAQPALMDGINANELAWGINISVRGGGIGQRSTLHPLVQTPPWSGLYHGGMLYQPDATDPILILGIGGRIYRVRVDTDNSVTDLSAQFGLGLPATADHAFFTQAEMFGVIQAGDFITNPLFYDFGVQGVRPETLRQSNGFIAAADPTNEIPPAGPMAYHAQRLWYGFGRNYAAGDIVRNLTSGTVGFEYRDSVLHVTENPVAYGGDAFVVPTVAGNIRSFGISANQNSALGESDLFILTRRSVYACAAPITRADWTASTFNNMPIQKVVLTRGGTYGDRCVVPVNTDLFFSGPPDGDVRSIRTAVRDSLTWGNVPLSNNINRALAQNDRSLMYASSGIQFDNRLLLTMLPILTPAGVGFQSVVPLDFDTISTFQTAVEANRSPAWEGIWDVSGGPQILQMFEGDFGGRERAFAVVWSELRSQIEVWEIRSDLRFDNGDNRVTRVVEFPAYAFGDPFGLKELDGGELWIDKLLGRVEITVEYRPDSYACWQFWHYIDRCSTKDCRDHVDNPCIDEGYPLSLDCEQDAIPLAFPRPPVPRCKPGDFRPTTWGYQFQVRLTIKGWCRIRGLLLHALWREKKPYEGLACPAPAAMIGGITR